MRLLRDRTLRHLTAKAEERGMAEGYRLGYAKALADMQQMALRRLPSRMWREVQLIRRAKAR